MLQPSAYWPHELQAWPAAAHVVALNPWQVPSIAQHPVGHDAAVQAHEPFEQTWPLAHAPDWPHEHTPSELQVLADPISQVWHVVPLMPQNLKPDDSHVVPEQQPFGHEAGVHWQLPIEQTCPCTHSAFPPQLQAPAVQPSASVGSHVAQPIPFVPHAPAVGTVQVAPAQQPVAQLLGEHPLQTPPAEQVPPGHGWHAEPPVPHALGEVPSSHVLPEQQPLGHELRLQTQPAVEQICPAPHAGPPRQVQAPAALQASPVWPQPVHAPPAVPHSVVVCASQMFPLQQPLGQEAGVHAHSPPEQTCPVAQADEEPHEQAPPLQPSASVVGHALQAAPAAPHSPADGEVTHTPSSQQPTGHELASQTQAPPTHSCPEAQTGPEPH